MCGEHTTSYDVTRHWGGSSPHVRGAHGNGLMALVIGGIIPACAGSTITLNLSTSTGRDHPRMCGEHERHVHRAAGLQGSSPHVRGAPNGMRRNVIGCGIIPACAGSTGRCFLLSRLTRDHPRMCGEHVMDASRSCRSAGSSPHVRGAHFGDEPRVVLRGIIPACAGSTRTIPA